MERETSLFSMKMVMPCDPNSLGTVSRYSLPNTLGQVEEEEVAARIISIAQDMGEWCGISLYYLFDIAAEEVVEYHHRKGWVLGKEFKEVPFSGVYFFGPEYLWKGIFGLLEKKLIQVFLYDGIDIIFPTPELVYRIKRRCQ